jgi:hypothetical protein
MGDLNIYTRDIDSVVTGFGIHQRVVATQPDQDGLYCRVDLVNNLPEPSVDQVLTVARKDQSVKGKWKLLSKEYYFSNGAERIDYQFYN